MVDFARDTIVDLVAEKAARQGGQVAFRSEVAGAYRAFTYAEFDAHVRHVAGALARAGLAPGAPIGILSRGCYEWEVADKAVMYRGGVSVGLDRGGVPAALQTLITTAGIRGLFVEDSALLDRLGPATLARLSFVAVFRRAGGDERHPDFWSLVEGEGGAPDPALARPRCRADDTAVVLFTSGTTGQPKGIPLTHRQLLGNIPFIAEQFLGRDSVAQHRTLSWIPLSTGTGRIMSTANFCLDVEQVFVPDPLTLPDRIQEFSPTYLVVVPRLLEKIHQQIRHRLGAASVAQRAVFNAIFAHRRLFSWPGLARLAEALLLGKLRRAIWGKSLRFLISGSAPIKRELVEFFDLLGAPTYEVYGLSEVAALITMNTPAARRPGSVGRVLPLHELRIADDGEVLVRSEMAVRSYWGEAESLRDAEGFLATGDLGRVEDGFVYLAGRKKEIIKTSTGVRVSPVAVEAEYADIPGVDQLVVVGNDRKHLTALVYLTEAHRHELARQGLPAAAYLERELAARAGRLPRPQRVVRAHLLAQPLGVETGELTSTLKYRRSFIERRFARELDALYERES